MREIQPTNFDADSNIIVSFAVALLAFAALTAFVYVLDLPLTDPDEALFACVARQMVRSGDWVVPFDRGKPFLDRPILHYWLMAGCVHHIGDCDIAYRLPSLFSGFLAVWYSGLIARRLFGCRAFVPTLAIAGSMPAFGLLAVGIGHDSSLVALIAIAVWANLRLLDSKTPRAIMNWSVTAGLVVGAAILAKGLLGLALPAIAVFFFALPSTRRVWSRLLAEIAIAVLVASCWYFPLESRVPGSLRYFFVQRHFGGFLTNAQRHGQNGMWIYFPTLLLGGLPWTFIGIASWLSKRRATRFSLPACGAERAVFWWLAATVAFFCIAGSKNPTYLLPAFISLAIASGRWASKMEPADWRRIVAFTVLFELSTAMAAKGYLESQRSSRFAISTLREMDISGFRLWWYFHLPPSARFYGWDFPFATVNEGELQAIPDRPTVLVCRESQFEAVRKTPFGQAATEHSRDSRYRILVLRPVKPTS